MIPDDWSQELLILETNFIYLVQKRLIEFESFFSFVNTISNPFNVVLYLYPCIAVFCGPFSNLSTDLMLVGSIASWTSIQMKWLLRGDRPFWWIKEIAKTYPKLPVLRQTRDTCIANPGNPSAHVMLTAGIMFVVFNAIFPLTENSRSCLSKSLGPINRSRNFWRIKLGLWTLYIIILIISMLSRIYNATHFPHQCILGAILGGMVASSVSANWSSDWQKRQKSLKILFYAAFPLVLSFATYWLQKAFGIDPQMSVRMAFKWCYSPMDISVNNTSIYLLTNSCGCMLGIAFALIFQRLANNFIGCQHFGQNITQNGLTLDSFAKKKLNFFHLANGVGVFISSYLLIELRKLIPTESVTLFYLYHFFINIVAPFLFLGVVPIVLGTLLKNLKAKQD